MNTIVRVGAPGAVTVIVPLLAVVAVLAVAFILNEPLPVRFVGVILEMVSHEVALLLTFHVALDVTLIVAKLATDVALTEELDNDSVAGAAACVNTTVRVGALGAVTVIVPLLAVLAVLAVAFILNEPLPVRFVGVILEMVSHEDALLLTFHVALDVTLTVPKVAADVTLNEE